MWLDKYDVFMREHHLEQHKVVVELRQEAQTLFSQGSRVLVRVETGMNLYDRYNITYIYSYCLSRPCVCIPHGKVQERPYCNKRIDDT